MTTSESFGLGVVAGILVCWAFMRVGDWVAAWIVRRRSR